MSENLPARCEISHGAVHLFLARVADGEEDATPLFPPEREREVLACRFAVVRREKRAVWRLLLTALAACGIAPQDAGFYRLPGGGWGCRAACFSLSHAGGCAAVAISADPVGVDIEPCPHPRLNDRIFRRMASPAEAARYPAPSPERVAALWTMKESLYKRACLREKEALPFYPERTDTLGADAQNFRLPALSLMLAVAPGSASICWHIDPDVLPLPYDRDAP